MSRTCHASGAWSGYASLPGQRYLKDQARIRERRRVATALRTLDPRQLGRILQAVSA
jgi:hypothetical protein